MTAFLLLTFTSGLLIGCGASRIVWVARHG